MSPTPRGGVLSCTLPLSSTLTITTPLSLILVYKCLELGVS
jgi:hypothetical protein